MQEVTVSTASARYSILIERGISRDITARAAAAGLTPSAFALVVDAAIADSHGAAALTSVRTAGLPATTHSVTAHETSKTLTAVQEICVQLSQAGLDRKSCVVAMGGGIIGDTAGFAAASYMRGVALIQVPTTLLAMVDASIGGKTGVNLMRADGSLAKNMVGAFWQPRAVLCDPDVLQTLPERELRCGLAECIKHAVISDPPLLAWINEHTPALLAREPAPLETLIARCAAIKAAVVSKDEREEGPRALLNLGHTFAHAFESLDHAHLKHGEAVAVGLVAALHLAEALGTAKSTSAWGVQRALERAGLPVRLPTPLSADALLAAMRTDKKAESGSLRMIVPHAMGDVRIANGVAEGVVRNALLAVGAN